ncbi:hypothetical protein ETB97_005188 [Aspergillus alliaceus]|uniref:GPI anchored serine-rich protein n=1 Tax=Petromyces alliaceus TaxID=209559 RepID=A0A5N6G2A3_PETAA|nr:uncharacterized protein BDW43DRAFT_254322 [Aspergillus alliaceus]KAB8236382.1 hypothetical protein BDW43DRAFT_254322 [Aspergillus alliaceus]KAE8391305.1 hypothetical protein BDV23DRAFT_153273 [Aspergillus alliaceus]KAF5857881.1 hypothetical protein ETB97_005188 [Aspergillus burnettii]
MRFSASTIALFAGLAAALPNGEVHTVYQTEDVTITSCAASVTDCPGRSTSTPEGVEPVTSAPPVAATSTAEVPPAEGTTSTPVVPVVPTSSAPAGTQVPSGSNGIPAVPSSSSPVIPQPPQVTSQSTTVIAVTTCIPTVTYSTITGPAPSGVSPGKSSSVPVIGTPGPSGSATPSTSAPGGLFTGAANSVGNSFGLAGAAAAAAFFLA